MTTTTIIHDPSDDDIKSQIEQRHLLSPPTDIKTVTFKPFPQSIIQSIEDNRNYRLPHAHSTPNVPNINQSFIDDDNDEKITTIRTSFNRKRRLQINNSKRSPSDIRINIDPDASIEPLTTSQNRISKLTEYDNDLHNSDLSLSESKSSKQNRIDLRRALLDHRFGRRIHSSFSSSTTLRSLARRRTTPISSHRLTRRQPYYLSRNSKWIFIRNHLHDIAMMNKSYARMKIIEQDLRWRHLREEICKRVLDMREISILRQQDDGKLKNSQKTSFDLKKIPIDEVVHVERDDRVYSIGTRDLVLGRLIGNENLELDTFAHLDARRKFAVKQNLLKQQEGRNRLKKYIAFSFCLCNLSFIALMFAAMFIFTTKTIIELKSRQNL